MENPQPVDINRLRGILGKSMAVMQKAENLSPTGLSDQSSRDQYEEDYAPPAPEITESLINSSRLPDEIKKLMIERPIPQMTNTFSAKDIYNEADEKEMPLQSLRRKPQPQPQQKTLLRESVGATGDMITISKSDLNNLINERLLEFMTKTYNKTIVENAISSTIKKLINENLISGKKKVL